VARQRRGPFAAASRDLTTVRDWLQFAIGQFKKARLAYGHGTDNARDEAAYLLLHTLRLPLDRLEPFLDTVLTATQRQRAAALFDRRITERAPAAYLTHEAWLGDNRFYVDERAIVPRSHIAELLRESLAPWVADRKAIRRGLDLCTGAGCLAILMAAAFPSARIDAADISADALAVARRNVRDYRLQRRVRLMRSNMFSRLGRDRYDLIVCNPPYVPSAAMRTLPVEYRHEPRAALAGGTDGLRFVRVLLTRASSHLIEGGLLVVEVGDGRRAVEHAFPRLPLTWVATSAGEDFVFFVRREDLAAVSLTAVRRALRPSRR
jgi:ribosomal protein L3 glutamine methyltransferase